MVFFFFTASLWHTGQRDTTSLLLLDFSDFDDDDTCEAGCSGCVIREDASSGGWILVSGADTVLIIDVLVGVRFIDTDVTDVYRCIPM